MGKFGSHDLKKLDRWDEKGEFTDIQLKVMNGEEMGKKEYRILKDMSSLPPELLQHAVDKGIISQQDADMLIVAGALFANGADSREDISKGLANFFSLSPNDRDFARNVMAERPDGLSDGGFNFISTLKNAHDSPSPEQSRLSYFLMNMEPGQQGWVQNFTTWNFDSGHSAMTAALGDIPDFNDMNSMQQDAMANFLAGLGNGWAPVPPPGGNHGPAHGPAHGPGPAAGGPEHGRPAFNPNQPGSDFGMPGGHFGPGDMMGPEFVDTLGFGDKGRVDLGSLMYQVMADRIDNLDKQVRDFADSLDQRNKEISTNTNAVIALRANLPGDGGEVDVRGLTFTDGNGNDVPLAGYLQQQGVITDSTDLSTMSDTDINNLMDSINAKTDTLNSESTAEMTKLQQHMDKYSQAVSAQTNFESKWNSMMQSITSNLRG
ncbi:MAG: hypothetical protein AAF936_08745 [Pseudomonadota bacterium]